LFSGKEKVLLAATKSPELHGEYADMLERFSRQTMLQSLQSGDPSLPERYARVYRSYLSVKNRGQSAAHTKTLMRNRIIRLQREKNITNYRLYTDLRVNPGNMNAFIKHGDCSKVSLDTARSAITFLERL